MEQRDEDEAEEDQTEFTYDELSDAAKQNAREWYRDGAFEDNWWDVVYEDAVNIGKLLGIEIGQSTGATTSGHRWPITEIYFQLDVQGSGACYSGQLHVSQLKDCVARVQAEVGQHNDDLNELAAQGHALYEAILVRAVTRRLRGEPMDDNYSVWGDLAEVGVDEDLPIEGDERRYMTRIGSSDAFFEAIRQAADAYVEAFANWVYHSLQAEADHMYTTEYAEEGIRANDYTFDEDGKVI